MKIMFFVQNISKYMNFEGDGEGHTWSTVHFLFIIQKKTEKVQEHDLY